MSTEELHKSNKRPVSNVTVVDSEILAKCPRLQDSESVVSLSETHPATANVRLVQSSVGVEEGTNRLALMSDGFLMTSAVWGERGVRKFMEDTHVVCLSLCRALAATHPQFPAVLDAAVFAIFDGHGGRLTSTFSRENLLTEIASEAMRLFGDQLSYDFYYTDREVQKLLKCVFAKLDSRIPVELPGCKDGSTAVLAFFPLSQRTPTMYVACLGDTAAYLSRTTSGTHHAIPLSEVHKPWMIKEKERILKCGGTVESGRVNGLLEVSRSLGDLSLKKYGVSSTPSFMKFVIDPEQDDFILLGCDGFWLNWTAVEALGKTRELIYKETRRLVTQGEKDPVPDLKEICKNIVNYVLMEKKSQDNVSIILVQFRKSNKAESKLATNTTKSGASPNSSFSLNGTSSQL